MFTFRAFIAKKKIEWIFKCYMNLKKTHIHNQHLFTLGIKKERNWEEEFLLYLLWFSQFVSPFTSAIYILILSRKEKNFSFWKMEVGRVRKFPTHAQFNCYSPKNVTLIHKFQKKFPQPDGGKCIWKWFSQYKISEI